MRLLHVTDRVSARGGADVHLLGVLASLVESGHEVTLAAARDDGSATPACAVALFDGLDALDRLAAEADVIHLHNAVAPDVMRWAASRGAVATVQDHRAFCPGRGKLTLATEPCREPMSASLCAGCFDDAAYHRRIQAVTEARLDALRGMRAVVVLSAYMRDELAAVGVEGARVIPPFVWGLDADASATGPPCILFAGRLVRSKGVHDAIAAHAQAGVELPLVLAGTGSLRNELEASHEVLGWLSREAMSGVFRRARALLLPSRWQEPFGIVGLEALTMGVPVVAWRSGGVEAWHPGGACLVAWGDVDALADALAEELADATGVAAPAGFDRASLMEQLEDVYWSLRK